MTSMQNPRRARFVVLFVCTGSQRRSPVAATLARRLLADRFGPVAAACFEIRTAGTDAVPGAHLDPSARAELTALGIDDVSLPNATPLSADAIEAADVVLTAEHAHRAAVVQLAPSALGKTFCLREFARLTSSVDCRGLPDESVALARAVVASARDRRGTVPPLPTPEDEIPDPMGRRTANYRRTITMISSACPLPEPDVEVPAQPGAAEADFVDESGEPFPGDAPAVPPRRGAVMLSLLCWAGSLVACLIGLTLALSSLPELRTRLEDMILQAEPDTEADLVSSGTGIILYGSLGATAVLITVQALLTVLTARQRGWARVLLAVVAAFSVPVLLTAMQIVDPWADAAFATEMILMVPAVVAIFLPAANSWFRQRRRR